MHGTFVHLVSYLNRLPNKLYNTLQRISNWPLESSHVLLIRCAFLQQFLHRYIISWGPMYIAVTATAGGHTMY